MTLPPCYGWSPVGQRLLVPYEAPQGRRVNVIGAYFTHGPEAGRFDFEACACLPKSRARKRRLTPEQAAAGHGLGAAAVGLLDAQRLIGFLWRVAGRPADAPAGWKRGRPLVVVLDNYSVHQSQSVREERAALEAADVYLLYLPSYCPELSGIEPVWHDVKHHRLPRRSYGSLGELKRAVDAALRRKAELLLAAHGNTEQSLQRDT